METLYRTIRLACRIPANEIASRVELSAQRMYQIETNIYGYNLQDAERLILALEEAIKERQTALANTRADM